MPGKLVIQREASRSLNKCADEVEVVLRDLESRSLGAFAVFNNCKVIFKADPSSVDDEQLTAAGMSRAEYEAAYHEERVDQAHGESPLGRSRWC